MITVKCKVNIKIDNEKHSKHENCYTTVCRLNNYEEMLVYMDIKDKKHSKDGKLLHHRIQIVTQYKYLLFNM